MKKRLLILMLSAIPLTATAERLTFPQYDALVEKHANLQGLDKNLIWAVMGRESSGNPNALSRKDARGLMQVIPPTAARMGVNPRYLYNPEQNLIAGTRYLRFLCNRYPDRSHPTGCNLDYVLAGYNAGEGKVDKYRGIPPYRETQAYVKNVKMRYARLSGSPAYASRRQTPQQQPVSVQVVSTAPQPQAAHAVPAVAHRKYESWDVFQEF